MNGRQFIPSCPIKRFTENGTLALLRVRQSGHCKYMFQSGSKYYLWNLIASEIWEIVTSMELVDIITEIGKPRYGSLEITKVYEA